MMMLNSNKQKMYYSLLTGETPVYKRDENGNIIYIDFDGNNVPIPAEDGDVELTYSIPETFFANIAFSSGEAQAVEYGVDVSSYDAVLVVEKGSIPITETSLIWFETEPQYKDVSKTIVDYKSADFKVLAVKPSLNVSKYILGRLPK